MSINATRSRKVYVSGMARPTNPHSGESIVRGGVRKSRSRIKSWSIEADNVRNFAENGRVFAQLWIRFSDNSLMCRIRHPKTRTEVTVLPASGKSAMGLVNARLVIADEPGSWKPADGLLMHDALQGAHGKPGSALRVLYVGTVAPAVSPHWWADLVEGGHRDQSTSPSTKETRTSGIGGTLSGRQTRS